MPRKTNHLANAVASLTKAQAEMEHTVRGHSKILEAQGQDIARLERQVMDLRNCAISAEVRAGVPSKTVAEKYGISPARVAQIAPRRLN